MSGARPPARAPVGIIRLWGTVLLLALVGTLNLADRWLPAILAELIKEDLNLSDTVLGLINGFGFLVIYAFVGIPIARLADRGAYGTVISVCIALWSAMTMLGGLVATGWQLAITRMGVAVGEAGNSPAAHAYISRTFDPQHRAAPLAVLTLSSPIAYMIGLFGGGLLGELIGWRNTFLVVGAAGLFLAPVVFLVVGSKPHGKSTTASLPVKPGKVMYLLKKRSYLILLAASGVVAIAGYALVTFGPAFLMRTYGMSVGEVGVQYGPISGVAGIVTLLTTGAVADRLSSRDPRWPLIVVALMIAISIPFSIIPFVVNDRWIAMISLAIAGSAPAAFQAPIIAAIQRLTPVNLRATASAVLLFSLALFGGLGPLLVGMLSDAFEPQYGAQALGRAILTFVPATLALSAALYWVATATYLDDIIEDADPNHAPQERPETSPSA